MRRRDSRVFRPPFNFSTGCLCGRLRPWVFPAGKIGVRVSADGSTSTPQKDVVLIDVTTSILGGTAGSAPGKPRLLQQKLIFWKGRPIVLSLRSDADFPRDTESVCSFLSQAIILRPAFDRESAMGTVVSLCICHRIQRCPVPTTFLVGGHRQLMVRACMMSTTRRSTRASCVA